MKQIRENVFETNSSSSHSFSFNICTDISTMEKIESDLITLNGDVFDTNATFYSFIEKANFLITACYHNNGSFIKYNASEDMIDEYVQNIKSVITDYTGCKKVQILPCNLHIKSDMDNIYISTDTQDYYNLDNLLSNKQFLLDFLFNSNSYLSLSFSDDDDY